MNRCDMELCLNWAGDGCVCDVLDLPRRLAACCDLHGEHCEPPADLCCTDCSAGVLPWTGQVTT